MFLHSRIFYPKVPSQKTNMSNKIFTKNKIYIALAAIFFVFVAFQIYQHFFKTPEYSTVEVQKITVSRNKTASGEIRSEDEVELTFPVSGKLINLAVKKNDPIKKWGYIGSLDKRQLQMQVEKSLRDYSKTRWDFDEAHEVTYKDTIITDTIRRVLDKNQFDLDKSVLDVEITDFAKNNADLYSPISGVVTNVNTHEGMNVIGGVTQIVTIANPQKMFFIAKIGEADIAGISIGQDATITLDAFEDRQFKGKVVEIDYAATISPNSGIKTYEVKVALNDLDQVKLDMSGDIEMTTVSRPDVLAIPSVAIKEKDNKKTVEILDGKQVIQKEVITGVRGDGGMIEILSGLNQGDRVIISKNGK